MTRDDFKCSHCGGTAFVIGKQGSYGAVCPNKILTMVRLPLYHEICLSCGTVVRSYVKEPEDLLL